MKKFKYILLSISLALSVVAGDSPSPKPFEMRLVLEQASNDAEQMTLIQKWHDVNNNEFERKEVLFVQKTALIDENDVQFAEVSSNSPSFVPRIRIVFTHLGAEHMGNVTRDNIGKRLAFLFDGQIYSAPKIYTRITREAEIAGRFNFQEAKDLVAKINKSSMSPTSQQ